MIRGMKTSSRPVNIIVWILQVLVAFAFFGAGGNKLAGAAQMVDMYNVISWGQWFRLLTGIIEVGCALVRLVPAWESYAAALLICTMVVATIAHLTVLNSPPTGPIVLLALLALVAWRRWPTA